MARIQIRPATVSNMILTATVFCALATLFGAVGQESGHAESEALRYRREVLRQPAQQIVLNGQAKGGSLVLCAPAGRTPALVTIQTQAGELAETIAGRLADAVSQSAEFKERASPLDVEGASLITRGDQNDGCYALAGTETGLGIPPPVTSVSVSYDVPNDKLVVQWDKPKAYEYDSIALSANELPLARALEGGATRWVLEHASTLDPLLFPVKDFDVVVVGYKGNTPSAAAGGRLTPCRQEEVENLPFRNGVAPNWIPWCESGDPSAATYAEGIKRFYEAAKPESLDSKQLAMKQGTSFPFVDPQDKPRFQILRARSNGAYGGVWRRFLGLTPGHTYRVRMRVNTLDMRASDATWNYTIHAIASSASAPIPAPAAMACRSPLPSGLDADPARIAAFGAGYGDTANGWVEIATDSNAAGKSVSGNIVLPNDADTIVVWTRHAGENTTGVAFDWIAVEDVGCLQDRQ